MDDSPFARNRFNEKGRVSALDHRKRPVTVDKVVILVLILILAVSEFCCESSSQKKPRHSHARPEIERRVLL